MVAKVITVINNRINVSRYNGTPPDQGAPDSARRINGGPIYDQQEVSDLALKIAVELWTRESQRDARKWYGDTEDVANLIEIAVKKGRFLGSFWCNQKPNGPWAACDSYQLNQRYWCDKRGKNVEQTDYLKFAISKTGSLLLSISNHPDGA